MTAQDEACAARRDLFVRSLHENGIDRCVIMTGSFRAGTSFIANLLAKNGLPSLRNEKFSVLAKMGGDPHPDRFAETVHSILSTATDGLFVSKIMWPHRNALARLLGYGRDASSDFAALFPNALWVNVTREDKVGQAISFWKAKETSQWGKRNGEQDAPAPDYDFAKIHKCFTELAAHDLLWRDFHALAQTRVRHVVYETFSAQKDDTLASLLDWLADHRLPSERFLNTSPFKIQRNAHSDACQARFLNDLYATGF